jgi:hypothetical protein
VPSPPDHRHCLRGDATPRHTRVEVECGTCLRHG